MATVQYTGAQLNDLGLGNSNLGVHARLAIAPEDIEYVEGDQDENGVFTISKIKILDDKLNNYPMVTQALVETAGNLQVQGL